MSRRRRRDGDSSTSSFDLFLDTICNTFGGIVFLAILLAMIIQNRRIEPTDASETTAGATPAEIRVLVREMDRLQSVLSALRMTLDAAPPPPSDPADVEYLALLSRSDQITEQIDQTVKTRVDVASTLASKLARNAAVAADNARVPRALRESENKLRQARSDFAALIDSKEQTIKLPRVRRNAGAMMMVLLRDHQFYVARKPSVFGQGFNDDQVTTSATRDGGIRVEPIEAAGVDIRSPGGKRQFNRVLADAQAAGLSIAIAVSPDSYGDFADLREAMIDRNVYYQLWPQAAGDTLTVYFGDGSSGVQ